MPLDYVAIKTFVKRDPLLANYVYLYLLVERPVDIYKVHQCIKMR